ncbi:MAG: hypothetical protein R2716_11110 [Microthrixaceae bacterium]
MAARFGQEETLVLVLEALGDRGEPEVAREVEDRARIAPARPRRPPR